MILQTYHDHLFLVFSEFSVSAPLSSFKVAAICMCAIKNSEVKEGRVNVFSSFFFPPSNSALSCQLSRMKEVSVYEVLYRGEVSLNPPQTQPQPPECKALRSSPRGLPRQPDLTVMPHKAELKQRACV